MADTPRGRTKPLAALPREQISDRIFRINSGGGRSVTIMACCNVVFEQPALNPLLALMPAVIHVKRAALDDPALLGLLDAMSSEVLDQRVGAATVLARLADVVITRLIRTWVEVGYKENREHTAGWLAAIRDPKIGRALAGIHRKPEQPWTVEALAKLAGLSRSMFSERFTAVMGVPPARYLATWRMHLASGWLLNDRLTVSQVSAKLGYESEPSFSRAFKRYVGVPPSALRRPRPQRIDG
jgi:AraC-like DNA-binding protein